MAEKEQKNKRMIAGVAFLAVLVFANLFVHGRRALNKKTPVTQSQSGASQNTNQVSAVTPVDKPVENSQLPAINILEIPDDPELDIKNKIKFLDEQFAKIKARLNEIPEPVSPPDISVDLILARKDLFKWENLPEGNTVSENPIAARPVATSTVPLQLLGEFTASGKKKLLVKDESRVFLVVENEEPDDDKIQLVSYSGNEFSIRDINGKTHIIRSERAEKDRLNKIVRLLKKGNFQSSYQINEMPEKSESEK